MEKSDFISNLDNLIEPIEIVLSKNRSSLSIDDVIRLENVIISLNELKKVSKVSDRKEILSELLPVIIRTFFSCRRYGGVKKSTRIPNKLVIDPFLIFYFDMNLGEAIKTQRKKLGISQGELAKSCEITQAYLSMIEKNKKEPNLSTLKVLSEKLDIPLPVLFFKSLDESDIPESKKEAYSVVSDSLNNLVNSLFFNEAKSL